MSKDIKKLSETQKNPELYLELISKVDEILDKGSYYEGLKLLDRIEAKYKDMEFIFYRRHVFDRLLNLVKNKVQSHDLDPLNDVILKRLDHELESVLMGKAEYLFSIYIGLKRLGFSEIAMYFLENGAERDVSQAQILLGLLHHEGRFFQKDESLAFYWFFRSAMLNDPDGLNALGSAFYEGIGTQINYDRAFKYMVKAYKMGITQSLGDIGYMYYMGLGTQQNTQKAYDKWIEGRDSNAVGCLNYLDTYFSKLDHH